LRALCAYFEIEIPKPVMANLVLETETRQLGVPAGLQDRVIQVYEGLVYMDFSRDLMESKGHGSYEPLDPALLPNVYVAYRTALSEGTEVFHNNVRERWRTGDPVVVEAMKTWGSYAEQGRAALLARDHATLDRLINANFDLRAQIYQIDKGNLQMIHTARMVGATSNFAGSGGAIVGTYRDERMFQELVSAMKPLGVGVLKPDVTGRPRSANAVQSA
jgi:glucuronokinase